MLINAVQALVDLAHQEQGLLYAPSYELSPRYTPALYARAGYIPASGWAPLAHLILGGLLEDDVLGFVSNAHIPSTSTRLLLLILSAQLLYTTRWCASGCPCR